MALKRMDNAGIVLAQGTPEEAFALTREYPADRMAIVQEGYDKEDLLGGPPVERRRPECRECSGKPPSHERAKDFF